MEMGSGDEKARCSWCGNDPLYVAYHDDEWGVPLHDDRRLFELLTLEGFQAGLSWITILRKRENFRKAFGGFDPARMARFTEKDVARLMGDAGIVRNRLKIEGSVLNARAYLKVLDEGGIFGRFLWGFTGFETLRGVGGTKSAESDAMSKELGRRGFKFVGSTICFAFMQASGMVDDHVAGCWKYRGQGLPGLPPLLAVD
jgi:DNA-3-methyladenine glycosylase I